MKNGKTVPFLDVFHFPAEKMRDENGNWTIRLVWGEIFEQTELIKAIKIISKLHCSDIKAQKCVCCELLRLREVAS